MGQHWQEVFLACGVLSPMISFWMLVFFGPKMGKPAAGWFAVVFGMGIPLALASAVTCHWWFIADDALRASLTANAVRFTWAHLGNTAITIGVKLDSLTVAMYFMVTFVAFWIFFFSIGYMEGHSDEVDGKCKYWRFFAYLSLFGFSMLGLVASSSLLFLFIFWELVGLCSYLLIGFYFDKQWPQYAQMKAFITNRVGDFGFLIGLMLVFLYLGTLDLDGAAAAFAHQYATHTGIFASHFTLFGWSLATIMGVGLFCGAMGKSSQFPLHVWLPDAMAGPTPVSALIHAATMVAAGVYLVARVFRLMTPDALMFVALIGTITLTAMGLVAIVQTDIKKCLAYSTLSQLGYMIFGMGCGAWIAALFHLITHAFFKAMLFLCSGQVIEGCHHEQDMRKMGGLAKKMPVTCWAFFVGVLAISGAGIPGLAIGSGEHATKLGIGGFFSKDEILAVGYARSYQWDDVSKFESHHGEEGGEAHDEARRPAEPSTAGAMLVSDPMNERAEGQAADAGGHGAGIASIFAKTPPLPKWMFLLAIFTAYVTPFYMMRMWWITFMGKPRDEHVHHHAHETWKMYVPLVVLSVGTLVASYYFFRPMIAMASRDATAAPAVMAINGELHTPAIAAAHHWLLIGAGFAYLIGFAIAIAIYRGGLDLADGIRRLPLMKQLHILLDKKYFIDDLYHFVWIKGCLLLAWCVKMIDTYVVDMVSNIMAKVVMMGASVTGNILDASGVDGVVNGVAKTSMDMSDVLRSPQTGRIRNYVMFAAGVAAVVLLIIVFRPDGAANPAAVAFGP